jgi:hypothetical protein
MLNSLNDKELTCTQDFNGREVAKLGIYKIIIFTISNLCDNMFLYDKFRMKQEESNTIFSWKIM